MRFNESPGKPGAPQKPTCDRQTREVNRGLKKRQNTLIVTHFPLPLRRPQSRGYEERRWAAS
eukprot:3460087-Pyramimonas_sp.AAC.1